MFSCAYWSGWSSWSSCSTTCGSGFRRKQRDCIGENLSLGYLCVGESVLDDACLVSEGSWAMWQQWSSCSATCGVASRSRLREHTCRLSTDYESHDCDLEDCCDISDWSEWTTCSVSCGSGVSSRSTRDCRGNTVNSERRTCVNQAPSSDWSQWSQCSVSCGRGIRYREISGPCIEATQESEVSLFSDYFFLISNYRLAKLEDAPAGRLGLPGLLATPAAEKERGAASATVNTEPQA